MDANIASSTTSPHSPVASQHGDIDVQAAAGADIVPLSSMEYWLVQRSSGLLVLAIKHVGLEEGRRVELGRHDGRSVTIPHVEVSSALPSGMVL